VPAERFVVIENGYDEETFEQCAQDRNDGTAPHSASGPFLLLHSGVVYPSERDPTQFFRALRTMLDKGTLGAGELRVRLRASAREALLGRMIGEHGVADVVELAPPVPYRDALREMMRADGLLVLQARNCNEQIPAKIYEYLRCSRPILALTDPPGDTAGLLRRAGIDNIASLDDSEAIARELRRFIDEARHGAARLADE